MKLKIVFISTALMLSGCSTLQEWTGLNEEVVDEQAQAEANDRAS